MVICKLCNKELKNNRALWSHLYNHHYEYSLDHGKLYYDCFIKDKDFNTKCPCCENEKLFFSISRGYSIGCKQHAKKINQLKCSKKRKLNGNYISWNKGKKDPLDVIQRKKDGRKKFICSNKGILWRKEASIRQLGKNNSCYKISAEKMIEANKKRSKTLKEKIKNGNFTPCVTNSWANSRAKLKINGFTKYYRSTWDCVFQILNPTFEYEKIRIPYINSNNQEKIYIVDFVDEKNKILYEIKPETLKTNTNNLLKTKYALDWCMKNGFLYKIVSNEYFKENAKLIDYAKYDDKIKNGMKQFL